MRNLLLLLVAIGLFAGVAVTQYHAPVYVAGGYGTTTTTYWNGFWLLDAGAQTAKHLTPNDRIYTSYNVAMDADNKNVVFAPNGTTSTSYSTYLQSGVYRIDPATLTVSTVLVSTIDLYGGRRLMVNQDGDYLMDTYQHIGSSYYYRALKLTSAGSTLTTIIDTTQLGVTSFSAYGIGINMDTGHYLIDIYSSPTFYYCVLDVDDNGNFTTFGGGASPNYGWYGLYSNMEQDHDTGNIVGMYSRVIYQLKQGDPTRTTLYNVGYPGGYYLYTYGSNLDLQSAPKKRIIGNGYVLNSNPTIYDPAIFYVDIDTPGFPVTAVNCDPTHAAGLTYMRYAYGQCIYQSRNVQTLKVGAKQWQLRISCPNYPGMAYAAAISLSGYRPPVVLGDGRKIHLVPDGYSLLSLAGLLKPFFDAGPGMLDKNGEAQGSLDFSLLPSVDIPIWIAAAVLDPKAPNGIAFLPDTKVFRVP